MKKLILLSFLSLFFFAGCSIITPNTSRNNVAVHLTDINGNNISYQVLSDIFAGSFTGLFQKYPLFADLPDDEPTNLMIGHGSMTGNMYTYNFPDVGIKFTFADIFASYFNPHDPSFFEPYMYYSGNILFYGKKKGAFSGQSIIIFSKNTGDSLVDIIQKDHALLFKDGCAPKIWNNTISLLSGSEYEIYNIEKNDSDACFIGVFFIANKKNPDRYYLLSYPDGCAPSCNTFTNIEFF